MFLAGAFRAPDVEGPDVQEERDPPPAPTPITFPQYDLRGEPAWIDGSQPPPFLSLFGRVTKPADITDEHAKSLNITVLPACSVDELIPRASDGSTYLPSLVPPDETKNGTGPDSSTPDPAAAKKQKELQERLVELQIENDLAFQVLSRRVPQGVRAPRLAYMRKFWEGLEAMSQYWDCSLDEFWETNEPDDQDGAKSAKRQRTSSSPQNNFTQDALVDQEVSPMSSPNPEPSDSTAKTYFKESGGNEPPGEDSGETPRLRYKGRRTGTGRGMPDQFRAEMVKGFVEGTVWPFRTSLSAPRLMPIVQFGNLNLPVRQTAAVYRAPNERTKARQGWIEGPILGVQARSETDFDSEDHLTHENKSRLDIMREMGGMLQLAQERCREGKTETKPGAGKWWTTEPRWGGGPGGEVGNESGNTDVIGSAEASSDGAKEGSDLKDKPSATERRAKALARIWKEVKPGRGFWDPKTEYKAIGTNPGSEYDDVFLVSSLNHHISILRMTIHGEYMACLTTGTMPNPHPEDPNWCSPVVRRSQWFDLFRMDQRKEAFRGLWGAMAYLTRETGQEAKEENAATLASK